MLNNYWKVLRSVRGADKSLTRPGRKQTTANKLGNFSTYSPRSAIHFLAPCSNVCKPLKKFSESCPSNHVSAAEILLRQTKNGELPIFFSVQRKGGSPTGSDPENRVGCQDIVSPGRIVTSRLQVPGEPGYFPARTRQPW